MLPNLVIAGAPKCGTSSLFKWLSDHPRACGSAVKETYYLLDPGHPLLRFARSSYHEQGLEGYERLFPGCRPGEHDVVFEATTHYLYQRTALEVVAGLPTRPHVAFVLRKPSERVYSSYQYTLNNLAKLDDRISFPRFVRLVKGEEDAGAPLDEVLGESAYVLKNDIGYSRYVEHLRPWVERLGRGRAHVLLFEDMRRDPRAFMKDFAARLGLDPSFYDSYSFPVRNETVRIKSRRLHRRARMFEGVLPGGAVRDFVRGLYLRAQSGGSGAPRKTEEDLRALEELEREFQPFSRRLASELGVDISAWGAPAAR